LAFEPGKCPAATSLSSNEIKKSIQLHHQLLKKNYYSLQTFTWETYDAKGTMTVSNIL